MFGKKKRAREAARQQEREVARQALLALIERVGKREVDAREAFDFAHYADTSLLRTGEGTGEYMRYSDVRPIALAILDLEEERKRTGWQLNYISSVGSREQMIYGLAGLVAVLSEAHSLNLPLLEGEFGVSLERLKARLIRLVNRHYEMLMEARHEGVARLEQLGSLIKDTHSAHGVYGGMIAGKFKAVGVPRLEYPTDWNDLVARFYESPDEGQFVLSDRDLNQVAQLADEASRQADGEKAFTDAQIALAYCKHPQTRAHVGDILFTKVTEIVNAYREANQPAATSAAEATE